MEALFGVPLGKGKGGNEEGRPEGPVGDEGSSSGGEESVDSSLSAHSAHSPRFLPGEAATPAGGGGDEGGSAGGGGSGSMEVGLEVGLEGAFEEVDAFEGRSRVLLRGPCPFASTASKTFACARCGESAAVSLRVAKFQAISRGGLGLGDLGAHAEFLVVVGLGPCTVGVWRRFSQFAKLAEAVARPEVRPEASFSD